MAALPSLGGLTFNYIDGIVLVWLIIGFFRGRKRGMTQELLPMLQWIAIVIVAGLFYAPFSDLIYNNTGGAFKHLWANITAYVLIAFGIHLLFIWIKESIGEKLVGSDLFGSKEYYLGMAAGTIRFACMLIALVAIMHARIYTAAELADMEKFQKKNFEDIRFPTYESIQHAVLSESYTGNLIEDHLHKILISSATGSTNSTETIAQKRQDTINAILGPQKK
jgi:uncharacterized membrane protein required for colicin V production